MSNKRIVFLDERGCNISENELKQLNDFNESHKQFYNTEYYGDNYTLTNHRYVAFCLSNKQNETLIAEFTLSNSRYRTTDKRTGRELKKAVREYCPLLHVNTYRYLSSGCYGDRETEQELWDQKINYTSNGMRYAIMHYLSAYYIFDLDGKSDIEFENYSVYKNMLELGKQDANNFKITYIMGNCIYCEKDSEYYNFIAYDNGNEKLINCRFNYIKNVWEN